MLPEAFSLTFQGKIFSRRLSGGSLPPAAFDPDVSLEICYVFFEHYLVVVCSYALLAPCF